MMLTVHKEPARPVAQNCVRRTTQHSSRKHKLSA